MITPLDAHPKALQAANPALNQPVEDEQILKNPKNNAATGVSAAGIRAISAQFVAFYFRAPVKAFFRTRVDWLAYAKAINPRVQAKESWSWRLSTPGLLAHAVKTYGWSFIPDQVLPPMIANVAVGALLYTSYLQVLGNLHEPSSHSTKRVYLPPPLNATFAAGFAAGSIQSVVAAPLDALQVRFRTSDMLKGQYKNMWQYGRYKLHDIGIRGVFAGWGLSFLKDSFGYGVFFATFEYVKAQSYYAFVTRYYGSLHPYLSAHPFRHDLKGLGTRPVIKPHYAIEPTFLLLAGVAASVTQQVIQVPLTLVQDIHYQGLEVLDKQARMENTRSGIMRTYIRAYEKTFKQCEVQATRAGGWRIWLYKGFLVNTLKQVPSTSAGLIMFELVRRKYGNQSEAARIEKDGYDILLS
ncbi:MAG: hypothetical protein M1827_002115 [Pycnora praestabilis]|nr:MAG: hypothetical protein M1827_002115 [Pycnora praestabilis]